MNGVVVDTSVWIESFRGGDSELDDIIADGQAYLTPLVAAELLSAPLPEQKRLRLARFLSELPLCAVPYDHWERVGALRADTAKHGISISVPDAHIAQCAIDLKAPLWSYDRIFSKIERVSNLRLFQPPH